MRITRIDSKKSVKKIFYKKKVKKQTAVSTIKMAVRFARGPDAHGVGFYPEWRTALAIKSLDRDITDFPSRLYRLLLETGGIHGTLVKDLYRAKYHEDFPTQPRKLVDVLKPVAAAGFCRLEMRAMPNAAPLLYVHPL